MRKSEKNRKQNGQNGQYKWKNNDLQNIHIQFKDRVTRVFTDRNSLLFN